MRIDAKCSNSKCEQCDKVEEVETSEHPMKCEKCGEPLRRVWTFNGGIRTGDGYKS